MFDLFAEVADDELYIVMELLDSDLHRIIQSPQPLTEVRAPLFADAAEAERVVRSELCG